MNKLNFSGRLTLLLAFSLCVGGCTRKGQVVPYAELASHLTNPLYMARGELATTKFFSSYDRTGGNNDYGFYLRDIEPGWGVIADCKGPGYVSRLWFTGESTNQRIRIYIDGKSKPALELVIKDFCGAFPPFLSPLAAYENYCYYNYTPIPFNKRIIIAIEKGVLKPDGPPKHYYQVNVEQLPASCTVESFTFPPSDEAVAILNKVRTEWNNFKLGKATDESDEALTGFSEKKIVAPGAALVVASIDGPALIRSLKMICEAEQCENPYEAWRSVLLNIYWDGAASPSVKVPIGDFFGIIQDKIPARSMFFDNSEKVLKNNFPMPFGRSARIELVNQGKGDFAVRVAAELERNFEGTNSFFYFHSFWNRSGQEDIGKPHIVLDVVGEGRYAGCILSAASFDKSFWLLEGDEIMSKDGEAEPFWRGTGLEDYFNGGWYYQNIKVRPLHGLLNKTFFRTVQYRFHLPDAVTFKKKFTMSFERGPEHKSNGYFESIAFYYLRELQAPPLVASEPDGRMPPADELEEANVMVELLNRERAGDYDAAAKYIDYFLKKHQTFPYGEMLKLRQVAYLEKVKGISEAKKNYEAYSLSTNNDVKSQAELLLWFNEERHNAIAGLNANTAARLWVDGKLITEVNAPHRLFVEKIKLNSGKHMMAIQFKNRPYPFWIQACIKTHNGLFYTDPSWKQAFNPKGNWAEASYDDSSWVQIGGTGCKGPPEEPFIWLEPNAFIEMQAIPVAIWSSIDWGDSRWIMVVRKAFEVP
jgi:hypothetical protein